nr:hypothetical protein [Mycobacteroides chelonae]
MRVPVTISAAIEMKEHVGALIQGPIRSSYRAISAGSVTGLAKPVTTTLQPHWCSELMWSVS